MLRTLLFWLKASRAVFLTGSIMPVLVCGAQAWHETGAFHPGLWLLTIIGMALLHLGANLANDYYDHLSGNDPANVEYVSPFTGGSRLIQEGRVEAWQMLAAALLLLALGSAVGLSLVWVRGWWILALGVVGAGTALFYTAPPLKLGYRGLGEAMIALNFGLLPALGAYYVQAGAFSWGAVAAGLPGTFLITAVLFINQFQDMRADAAVDKRHWVVRLGRRRARVVYVALVAGALVSVPAGVALGWLPVPALVALLAFIPLGGVLPALRRHYDDPERLAPANAGTVAMHLLAGVLLTAGIVAGTLLG